MEEVREIGQETGTCLAMPGTEQGHSGYYEMWWNDYEQSTVVAKFEVDEGDGSWTLVGGAWHINDLKLALRSRRMREGAGETEGGVGTSRLKQRLVKEEKGDGSFVVTLDSTNEEHTVAASALRVVGDAEAPKAHAAEAAKLAMQAMGLEVEREMRLGNERRSARHAAATKNEHRLNDH
jgi:hypothetical protein